MIPILIDRNKGTLSLGGVSNKGTLSLGGVSKRNKYWVAQSCATTFQLCVLC